MLKFKSNLNRFLKPAPFRIWKGVLCFCLLPLFQANAFQVGNWNIHNGKELKTVIEKIKTSELKKADLLSFQEVVDDSTQTQSQELAAATGLSVYAPGRDIILSRFPFVKTGELALNSGGRTATWAVVQLPNQKELLFYSVHLSYKYGINPFVSSRRGKEMQVILDHAESFSGPILVTGDFNSIGWLIMRFGKEAAIRKLKKAGFTDAHDGLSFRTHKLVGHIDWQFSKGLKVLDQKVGDYTGSDHRWLTAEYEVLN